MSNPSEQLKKRIPQLQSNIVLAPFTSFKIGGPAKFFYIARTNHDAIHAITTARNLNVPFFILGNGTNILIADHGFDGLVIKMENRNVIFQGTVVYAESGVALQKLIREAIAKNLSGLEHCIGIPGTVGGGVVGNVGTPTEWIDSVITFVEIINASNGNEQIPRSQCDFSYRLSRFKYSKTEVVLGAQFHLRNESPTRIQQKVNQYLNKRAHQPSTHPSAGSTFKNPPQKKAWQLIDAAGLRGKQIGGAKVSSEHSNFIINTGSATAEDVVVLISLIKQQVRDKLGTQLQEEIRYIGF